MQLSSIFDRFVEESPLSVMVRGLAERVLNPDKLDEWFEQTQEAQYTRDLSVCSCLGPYDMITWHVPTCDESRQKRSIE